MLLVEYRLLDKLKVINEGTGPNKKLKVRGKFQKCDEQNNNGRIYPKKILESQVTSLQEKIKDRALVGALDHPPNDAIHLSQASHLITKLWVESNGDVMGEAEILSTPSGKIVEALLNDGVKIGISSRGLGTISEGKNGKIVNEDFKLITFDLVSDPSTKGAFPELTESVKLNSQKAQRIVSKIKQQRILLTVLESKINERLEESKKKNRCWDGYEPTPGKKPYSDGSCKKAGSKKDLDEGLVKQANKSKKKDWEVSQNKNYSDNYSKVKSRIERRISADPKTRSEIDKRVRDTAHKSKNVGADVRKDAYKTYLKSQKKPNLPESVKMNTTLITLSEMLIEGIVKKLNKAKKKDWETSGETNKYVADSRKTRSRLNRKLSPGPDSVSRVDKAVRGQATKNKISKDAYKTYLKSQKKPNLPESIEQILQRVEEGTATSDDIELVKRALSEIVNR